MLLHGSTSALPIASDLALDMIVLKRTRKQTGSRGVGPPVRHRQAADEAQHLGQVLALRPVVGDLVFEVVEADLGVVPVRGRASWSVSNRTITRAFPGGRRCGSLMWISPFSSIWASISMACIDFRLFGRYSLSAQPALTGTSVSYLWLVAWSPRVPGCFGCHRVGRGLVGITPQFKHRQRLVGEIGYRIFRERIPHGFAPALVA